MSDTKEPAYTNQFIQCRKCGADFELNGDIDLDTYSCPECHRCYGWDIVDDELECSNLD